MFEINNLASHHQEGLYVDTISKCTFSENSVLLHQMNQCCVGIVCGMETEEWTNSVCRAFQTHSEF